MEEIGVELPYARYSEENVQQGEEEFSEQTVSITLGRESDDEEDEFNQNGNLRLQEYSIPKKRFTGLSFHDVSYEVMQRKRCRKLPNKTILHSIRCVRLPMIQYRHVYTSSYVLDTSITILSLNSQHYSYGHNFFNHLIV